MAVQQQLHAKYHGYWQLRDRLMHVVNISRFQDTLTYRQPRTSNQLIERVANKLSHKQRTAGTSVALIAPSQPQPEAS